MEKGFTKFIHSQGHIDPALQEFQKAYWKLSQFSSQPETGGFGGVPETPGISIT